MFVSKTKAFVFIEIQHWERFLAYIIAPNKNNICFANLWRFFYFNFFKHCWNLKTAFRMLSYV